MVYQWTFGDRIRKVRRTAGMSSRDFAAALGVTNSGLAQWETDRSLPRDIKGAAAKVSELTGVSAHWLVTGECPPPKPVAQDSQED